MLPFDFGRSSRARGGVGGGFSHHGSWKISPRTSFTPDRHSNVSGPCSGKRLLFATPPMLVIAPSDPPPIAVSNAGCRLPSVSVGLSQDAPGEYEVTDEVVVGTGVQVASGSGRPTTDGSRWSNFDEWPFEIAARATPAVTAPTAVPRQPPEQSSLTTTPLPVVSSGMSAASSCCDDEAPPTKGGTAWIGTMATLAPSSAISKRLDVSLAPLLATRNFWRPPYPRKLLLYLFHKTKRGKWSINSSPTAVYVRKNPT